MIFHSTRQRKHIFSRKLAIAGVQKKKAQTFRLGLFKLKRATSYAPTHLRVQYHRG